MPARHPAPGSALQGNHKAMGGGPLSSRAFIYKDESAPCRARLVSREAEPPAAACVALPALPAEGEAVFLPDTWGSQACGHLRTADRVNYILPTKNLCPSIIKGPSPLHARLGMHKPGGDHSLA